MWKNEKFTLTEKIIRQINYLVISLVKPLLSRKFCQKCVRVNFRNFHTVKGSMCRETFSYSFLRKVSRKQRFFPFKEITKKLKLIWRNFSSVREFWQKFRESNVYTREINWVDLTKYFLARLNVSFSTLCVWNTVWNKEKFTLLQHMCLSTMNLNYKW